MAADGLIKVQSSHGPADTMERLVAEIGAKGLTVFARINHAAGAEEVGLALRPTELVIFGNAKGGTPLMQANQEIGIDLPLKALVWQDAPAPPGFRTTIQPGSRSGMDWVPKSNRRSRPCRQCWARSRGRPQGTARGFNMPEVLGRIIK